MSSLTGPQTSRGELGANRIILLVITLLLSGRAMTLAFIADVGDSGVGDPPDAWLMPLVGDAAIGLAALVIAYLIVWKRGLGVWTAIVVWNVVGIWDALAAYLVHRSVPWHEFFMIETFGSTMFFAASGMHLVALWLVAHTETRAHFMPGRLS